MSFILKALKKVEDEKTARTAPPADLNRVIIGGVRSDSKGTRKFFVAGVLLLVFAAGGSLTWFAARVVPIRSTPPVAPATSSREQAAPAPVNPLLLPAQPQQAVKPPPVPVAPKDIAQAPPAKLPPVVPPKPDRKKIAPVTVKSQQSEISVPPLQGLALNGIAVRDDAAESIAIVNGIMLKRGMTVQGAKVERIYPEKVVFSGNGGIFDLQLPK